MPLPGALVSTLIFTIAVPPPPAPVPPPPPAGGVLEIVKGPAPVPPRAYPPPDRASGYSRMRVIGMMAISPLAPAAFHLRAGGSTRTGGGVALLSGVHRGWVVSRSSEDVGFTRFGGSVASLELTKDRRFNGFLLPLEFQLATGARVPIDGRLFFHGVAGFDSLVRVSPSNDGAQRKRGYLHAPELNVGIHYQKRRLFWEIGPLGGLALVGHDTVGFGNDAPRAGVGTYAFRPYAGGLASIATRWVLATVSAHRTWLDGAPGKHDDRITGMVCHPLGEMRHESGLGSCLSTDVSRATSKAAPTALSFEVTLRIGLFFLAG